MRATRPADAFHLLLLRVYRRVPRRSKGFLVRLLSPTFSVGAMCVIEGPDGGVLLLRHSYRSGWGLPGGLLQRGEAPDAAARREVAEEVGLRVELTGTPRVFVDPKARRVDIVFRARPADDEVDSPATASSPEIVDTRWFPPTELPPMQKEAAQAVALILGLPA